MRRRTLIYAALALMVPLPALAVPGRGGPAELPPQELIVTASLDTCGTAADSIVCKIDAAWNQIPGADRYTASVTRADGSVVDFGDVGAGSASFWVPYVGNGTYTVSVSAYGTPPGSEDDEVVARDSAAAGSQEGREEQTLETPGPDATGGPAADEDPADPSGEPEPEPEEPTCEEPEPEPEPEPPVADPAAQPTEGDADAGAEPLSAEASAELDASAELPESVDCPEDDPAAGPATG